MEQKEIKINCPEGFEVDKENSTFECIKFKPIKNEFPKTWEEYCKNTKRKVGEAWINEENTIKIVESSNANFYKSSNEDKNLLPSKKYAEAMLALCQLIQLRDCYNDGWTPNWEKEEQIKFCIEVCGNKIVCNGWKSFAKVLAFKSKELCNEFLKNFKDLIEIAKPLI